MTTHPEIIRATIRLVREAGAKAGAQIRAKARQEVDEAVDFCKEMNFLLPPFAFWTLEDWKTKGEDYIEIMDNQMGWDITDFGSGDFSRLGLFLFTVRNGSPQNWKTMKGKLYAEKVMVAEQGQVTPYHFHWSKMEDIINRGGGKLMIKLYNSTPAEDLSGRQADRRW